MLCLQVSFQTSQVTRPKQPLDNEGAGTKNKMATIPQQKRSNKRYDVSTCKRYDLRVRASF